MVVTSWADWDSWFPTLFTKNAKRRSFDSLRSLGMTGHSVNWDQMDLKAFWAAAMVAAISCCPWAVLKKAASNCEGGSQTPASNIE